MDASHVPESFRGLLLRHRGRTGLIQRELAARAGVSLRSVQDWEAGVSFPTAERLEGLLRALLEAGGLTAGRETSEARDLWTAVEREAPRMHISFDAEWFAGVLRVAEGPPERGAERAQDWGEAPDTAGLVGRGDELALLHTWLLEERCRLVAVLGMGGIGKTSLTAWAAQRVAPSFERVYWRSLRNAPPVTDWLAGAIGFLSDQQLVPPAVESEQISTLLHVLRARRCLLVLDNAETLFEPGQRDGQYRAGLDGYGRLLQAVGERPHQSCLVLTSREAPPELAILTGVRELELHGLGVAAAQALLADKQLTGDTQAWLSLVDRYAGNGLALRIVGETIRQVYDGDVAAFLADALATYGSVFGGIRRLLDDQEERLSAIERHVLTSMAVRREPINMAELSADMAPRVAQSTVIDAIETLRRRSLVERAEEGATFTLQSIVLEYITDRLVETVANEIGRGQPGVLVELPLIQAQAKDYVRQTQERLIGGAILQQLKAERAEAGPDTRLFALLERWRGRPAAEQGYGPGNVANLLRLLRGNLRGMDFSRLVLREVYLQAVDAQEASLAGARLDRAVLAEAFGYARAVALSPDGGLVAAGTPSGEVRLWRVADRTPLRVVQAHTGMVWCVALSGNGRLVASGGADRMVRLWEVGSGQLLASLQGHTGAVRGVALTGDGRLVASGGDDGTVRLWEVGSGQLVASLRSQSRAVWAVALSADGRLVASGDVDGVVRLWDTGSGQRVASVQGHPGVVFSVALSGDGRLVASGGVDGTVRLWEAASGQLLASLEGHAHAVCGVALSRDRRLVASGGADGLVRLWEAGSGQLLASLRGHTGAVWGVALSGDGRLVASSGWDGTVRLWEAASGQLLGMLQGHTGVVLGVALSGDGRLIANGGDDGMVRLWEAASGQLLTSFQGPPNVLRGLALSGDGRLVASSNADGTVRLWETESGQLLGSLRGHTGTVWCVALSGDGRLLASGGDDGMVRLWETGSGQLLASLPGRSGVVLGVALSGDGRLLASGGADGTVRMWATGDGRPRAKLQGHRGRVTRVALSGDGRLLASGGFDGTVRLWETGSGQLLATLQGHTGGVFGLALSGDGRLVASSGADEMVRVWETGSRELLVTLQGHTGAVWPVALSWDGRLLASGGDDGMVRLWETGSGACLRTLRSDRRYQRLDITGLTGVTDAQRAALLELGAIDHAATPTAAPAI